MLQWISILNLSELWGRVVYFRSETAKKLFKSSHLIFFYCNRQINIRLNLKDTKLLNKEKVLKNTMQIFLFGHSVMKNQTEKIDSALRLGKV